MTDVMIEPIIDEPAMVVTGQRTSLIIADIHLGIEWDLYKSGFSIPSQSHNILEHILDLVRQVCPDNIILLGDIKHNVPQISWQEKDEIPSFLSVLSEHASIDIFPGNHDGGLEVLLPKGCDVNVHSSRGAILDSVGYFHGHTWPDVQLLSAKHIIIAHNHPIIRFTDSMGSSTAEKVWFKSRFNKDALAKHFKSSFDALDDKQTKQTYPDIFVMPAFNELCGGVDLSDSHSNNLLCPVLSSGSVEIAKAEIYLLDGTFLGLLKDICKLNQKQLPTNKTRKSVNNHI